MLRSKCPDARDCIEKLIVPTMANVSDKVDFRLSYIGKYVRPSINTRIDSSYQRSSRIIRFILT